MLILTRKVDQGCRLYDATGRYVGRVLVLGVQWQHGSLPRVKLGFEVDERFVVLRDELLQDAAPENKAASA